MDNVIKFSICIPTYNRGSDLLYTIKSVINQSYPHWELNIIDDSQNNDAQTILNYLNDKRISYFKNPERLGLVKNWNECLKRANYEYCMILHHDDFLVKDALQNYKQFLDIYPSAKFIHANSYIANLPFSSKIMCQLKPKKIVLNAGDEGVLDVLLKYGVTCSTVVMHKNCIEKAGYYDEDCWVSPDWEYSARIAQYFKTYFLEIPTVVYVYHNSNAHINAYDVHEFAKQSRYHFQKAKTYLIDIPVGIDEIAESDLLNAIKGLAVMIFTTGKYSKSYEFFKYARKKVTYKTLLYAIVKRIIYIYKKFLFRKISYKKLFEKNFNKSIK